MTDTTKAATPHAQLIQELMDPRVPKTEREHAALRDLAAAGAKIVELQTELHNRHERLLTESQYHDLHAATDDILSRAERTTGSTRLTLQGRIIRGELWQGLRAKKELIDCRRKLAELERERDALREGAERYRYVRAHVSRIFNEDTLKMDGLRVEVYYEEPQPYILQHSKDDISALFDVAIDTARGRGDG